MTSYIHNVSPVTRHAFSPPYHYCYMASSKWAHMVVARARAVSDRNACILHQYCPSLDAFPHTHTHAQKKHTPYLNYGFTSNARCRRPDVVVAPNMCGGWRHKSARFSTSGEKLQKHTKSLIRCNTRCVYLKCLPHSVHRTWLRGRAIDSMYRKLSAHCIESN